MNNKLLYKLDSIVEISITGKNIHNYIKRVLLKNKINIIKLTYINYKEVLVILKYSDYLKLLDNRSIYEISLIRKYGKLKFIDRINKNFVLLISIIMGISIIYILSNFIYSIDVIHSVKSVRDLVNNELERNGITKYSWKKSYGELERIEDKILEDNKDKLEWIEITTNGTRYIVRVEERKIKTDNSYFEYQSIVARKNCILYEVNASKGEKVRLPNQYVKKGDVVISGYITLPDNNKIASMAEGKVLGEVWYTIDVSYPYTYYEEKYTGKKKNVLVIHFYNKDIPILSFNHFRSFKTKSNELVSNNISNISLTLDKQYEVKIISKIYTYEEVIDRAIKEGIKRLKEDNNKIIDILATEILKEYDNGDRIVVKYFVKAIEDVGEVIKIDENIEETGE